MTHEFIVYPRLKKAAAAKLAAKLGSQPVLELASEYNGIHQVKVDYAPTGNRVRPNELLELQKQVRACASEFGYPETEKISNAMYGGFDAQCASTLHQTMKIYPAEASHIEVWAFITCVLLPDIVRWRFYDTTTKSERFIGTDRGLRRNTLGRLWWRAYLLHQPKQTNPYTLLQQLGEDEIVQLTERPTIARNPVLITAAAETFLSIVESQPDVRRRYIMREAAKRIQRLISLISFEALDEITVKTIMQTTFEQTKQALLASNVESASA